jgi:hypothetical protein
MSDDSAGEGKPGDDGVGCLDVVANEQPASRT